MRLIHLHPRGEVGQDLFCTVAFERDGPRRRGPDEGFWVGVAMIDPFDDSRLEFGNAVEDAAAYLLARDLGRSTRLSQEEDVGMKCSLKRGWRLSQRCTAAVLWVA